MSSNGDECACGCGKTLKGAASHYFATEACQRQWTRRQAGVPAQVPPPTQWTSIDDTIPTTARWWSYDPILALWHLRETNGTTTTIVHTITDECATRTPAGYIEDHLRRAIGGHIPTLPLAYLN